MPALGCRLAGLQLLLSVLVLTTIAAPAVAAERGGVASPRADARVGATGAPRARPAVPLAGELVTLSGTLGRSVRRVAVVQRRTPTGWRTLHSARIPASGHYSFVVHQTARPSQWRVVAPRARDGARTYRARRTSASRLAVAQQSAVFDAPDAVRSGAVVSLTAHLRPVRPGRSVTLRSTSGETSTTFHPAREDATGTVHFTVRATSSGWIDWQLVARASNGAVAYTGPTVRTGIIPVRPVQIAAHAGGAKDFPVNSLAGIRNAIRSSTDWVEVDLRPTADGDWVLFHDSDLRHTTNIADTPLASRASDRVEQFTVAELKTLDAGSWKSPQFACRPDSGPLDDCRIPTLEQFVDTVDAAQQAAGHNVRLLLEFKSDGVADRADMNALVDRVRTLRPSWVGPGHADKALFLSFDYATVFDDLRHDVDTDGRPISELVPLLSRPSEISAAPTAWAAMLDLAVPLVQPSTVAELRAAGAAVIGAWTADRPSDILAMGVRGVDVLTTDDVPTARSVLLR